MLMICSFPPPATGQSLVHEALRERFRRSAPSAVYHDIAPGPHQGVAYHLTRARRVAAAVARLLVSGHDKVYLSSEAGFGVFYSLMLVGAARLRRKTMFFHHHVYNYIAARSVPHLVVMRLAGRRCTHITLSPQMSADFARRFEPAGACTTLHNAIFVEPALRAGVAERRVAPERLTIGFISRLEASKGFEEFLALIERFADAPRLHVVVAGAHEGSPYADALARLQAKLGPRLVLLGFVSAARKVEFFRTIDVLVFPTKYRNEASPMVCYEALAMGVPVLVTRVGAVADIVTADCGGVFEPGPDLVDRLAAALRAYAAAPARLAAHQQAAAARFRELERRGEAELAQLAARAAEPLDAGARAPARWRPPK